MHAFLRRLVVLGLMATIIGTPVLAVAAQPRTAPNEPELWRAMLERLDAAVVVVVRLKDGSRTKGTVLHVGDETFTFKPHTRVPVPAREVAFSDVTTIERQKDGMNRTQKVLLGTSVGVSSLFLVLMALMAAA